MTGSDVVVEPPAQQLGAGGDDAEDVIEVMGHAAGQPPDGFHLLRLAKLILGRFWIVMSRAMAEAPTISPSVARIGDTEMDTSRRLPSLATRTDSK